MFSFLWNTLLYVRAYIWFVVTETIQDIFRAFSNENPFFFCLKRDSRFHWCELYARKETSVQNFFTLFIDVKAKKLN